MTAPHYSVFIAAALAGEAVPERLPDPVEPAEGADPPAEAAADAAAAGLHLEAEAPAARHAVCLAVSLCDVRWPPLARSKCTACPGPG